MSSEVDPFPKVLTILLELSQYPILAPQIRSRMRQELFNRGVILPEAFEREVRQKAIDSQQREGLHDPFAEEPADAWATRLGIVRDHLTDFYFAYNLPHDLFEDLVREALAQRVPSDQVVLTFHPELAPWEMLFAQGEAYEAMPPGQRSKIEHHLKEIKVVLIRAMISDHLEYVGIAKQWFTIQELQSIRSRRIGRGKIGGKAAGIELARSILSKTEGMDKQLIPQYPRSWFLAADSFYHFTHLNNLLEFANQKYRSEEQIREQFSTIQREFHKGQFPDEIVEQLGGILKQVGSSPLIVRSSSLLEDSFGYSFAGKYESHFLPNQAGPKQNLRHLLQAISRIYASVYSPDVLLYRRRKGLLDYDERMAILIQEVKGRRIGDRYLPDAAGVAFSRNQYRWSPVIDRNAGFVRLVWGLGTRAVEQHSGDYPRLVALSHPDLKPEADPQRIRRYSQHFVDHIDLAANEFRTSPVSEALGLGLTPLRWIAQRYADGLLGDLVSTPLQFKPHELVVTFDGMLRRSSFAPGMIEILKTLEAAYGWPVDIEFLVILPDEGTGYLQPSLYLLQCRPQSQLERSSVELPQGIPDNRRLFVSHRLIPDGRVSQIRYAVYISPLLFQRTVPETSRQELARLISRINTRLERQNYMLMGPGRWGSQNPGLGIPVAYGDIYNARALVEIAQDRLAPEPSYGTHFFQDLVESHIYPLALAIADGKDEFNREFFERSPNQLPELLPEDGQWADVVRVIDISLASGGSLAELVMNGEAGMAIAFLQPAGGAEPDESPGPEGALIG